MKRRFRCQTAIIFLMVLLLGSAYVFVPRAPLYAAQAPASTKVIHTPIPHFVPEHRITIEARVTDESGIELVRCYFKTDKQAEYVFVPMTETRGGYYRAILPAPADYAEQIRYLVLIVNQNQQVVKTQAFSVEKALDAKEAPEWQKAGLDESIAVYTELPTPPETLAGFTDNVTLDAVESSLRFGMVAGIYSASATASAGPVTGAAATASSAGTVTATTGVFTTAAIATIAGAAAGAGLIAAAAGNGGGGGTNETINPVASVAWRDEKVPPEDEFQAFFGPENLGVTSSIQKKTGLPVGDYDLTIRAVSVSGQSGFVVVELGGGAYFIDSGSIRKRAELVAGGSVVFQVFVPDTGSALIEW